ncbi:hypothetical protein J6590_013453 [Homalodisca vitripennis]|nr:hypothetical protein J6590_013453 [Homalodisca vitripennis]
MDRWCEDLTEQKKGGAIQSKVDGNDKKCYGHRQDLNPRVIQSSFCYLSLGSVYYRRAAFNCDTGQIINLVADIVSGPPRGFVVLRTMIGDDLENTCGLGH